MPCRSAIISQDARIMSHGVVACLLVVFASFRRASGWTLNIDVPFQAAMKHVGQARHSTSLSLTPRDVERLSEGSDSEEDGDAELAARAAREALEKMWSSSTQPSYDKPPTGELNNSDRTFESRELPELAGEQEGGEGAQDLEVRRESPFPSSSERGALEAAAASQKALVAGKRGLIIDVEVKELDDESPEFDPDLMIHFVTEVGKNLASVTGKTTIMLRGDHLVTRATETLHRENIQAVEAGFDPREDVSFCSMRTRNLDDEGEPDSMDEFATRTARKISDDERLVMIIGPRSNADVIVMREVVKAARGRSVVLVNPRMTYMPRETSEYDTAYLLRQFTVRPVKKDPKKEAKKSPFRITSRQRKQQAIFSELGQEVPKVLLTRAFPDDFKLYVDIDGKGFLLEDTYDEKPHPSMVCLGAQTIIEEAQRRVSMKARMTAATERQREILAMWDEDEDDDDDDDNDVVPRRLTDEEIDSRLRD